VTSGLGRAGGIVQPYVESTQRRLMWHLPWRTPRRNRHRRANAPGVTDCATACRACSLAVRLATYVAAMVPPPMKYEGNSSGRGTWWGSRDVWIYVSRDQRPEECTGYWAWTWRRHTVGDLAEAHSLPAGVAEVAWASGRRSGYYPGQEHQNVARHAQHEGNHPPPTLPLSPPLEFTQPPAPIAGVSTEQAGHEADIEHTT
jgi:hypothetical protein